jgi:hypothetical protein
VRSPTVKILFAVLCLFAAALPVQARTRRSLPVWEWSLAASLGMTYDDNVLGFSERDRNNFLRDPDSFPTPLKSVDDLETTLTVRPALQWRAPLTLMVSGDYRLKAVHRVRNGFSDYQTHLVGLSLRPRKFGYPWSVRLRILAIPSHYLRVYRDRDYSQRFATRYSNWDYAASFRYRVMSPLWLEAGASYGTYYYNDKFTEYDSEQRDFTLGASGDLPWSETRLNVGYTRRFSDNVGKNQAGALRVVPGEPGEIEDTEYGDSDYNEDDIALSISAALPTARFLPTEGALGYRHRRRVYTTERPLSSDPFHRGRLDNRGQWQISLTTHPSRVWETEVFFAYESRRTDSEEPIVPLVKDFIRREIGLILTYRIR